ncbi:MAG TPA: tetratricopeptide repeat protein [Bacteroidales bacterium]|nr:tetratricopeptide repeat protein [Bacteroidales bacterium]
MAKKSKDDPGRMKNVEQTLTKTEQFLEANYKSLSIGLGIIVALVALFWLGRMYLNKRNAEAQSQMYQAERYLEMDSLYLALNGDGNYLGFLDITNDYKLTHAGNLARYSAGVCYLHLGQFDEAIEMLRKYRKRDKILGSLAIGATGDAYVELGEVEKGIAKYLEAAEFAGNSFNTPLFLMKAGELQELNGNYAEALKIYERIHNEYSESTEGASIEKYIARIKLLI